MTVIAAPLRPTGRQEEDEDGGRTAELRTAVDQELLDLLGWSDEVGMLFFPYDHDLLGMPKCRVTGCSQASVARQLCEGCRLRWRQAGLTWTSTWSMPAPVRAGPEWRTAR